MSRCGKRIVMAGLLALLVGLSAGGCATVETGSGSVPVKSGRWCADPFAPGCGPGSGWVGGMGP
jgi:hypothetical protein